MKKVIIILAFLVSACFSQRWFITVIEDSFPGIVDFGTPVISINPDGDIEVIYTIETATNEIVCYRKSTDNGQTFLPRVIVEDDPIPGTYFYERYARGIHYDSSGNTMVVYIYVWAPYYFHRIRKSYDSGQTFSQCYFNY